jgi:hypothetical protein
MTVDIVFRLTSGIVTDIRAFEDGNNAMAYYEDLARSSGVEYDFDGTHYTDTSIEDLMSEVESQLKHSRYQLHWHSIETIPSNEDET